MDALITGAIVAAALVYVAHHFWKSRKGGSCGCGDSCGCGSGSGCAGQHRGCGCGK